ncbi:MAG TPA: hypothetical protein VJU61_05235, partial [Polyangiaceae bacterium]|nr:hypothetical protein [Polyangiaceae bacterium]
MAANRVFSGQCRVEAIAGDSQGLIFENLRVHLDLQLEPEATDPLPAGSRAESRLDSTATERALPRRRPRRASALPTHQQWAVLAALASLLFALASWWVGGEP